MGRDPRPEAERVRAAPYARYRLRLERTADPRYRDPPCVARIGEAARWLHEIVAGEPHEVLGALFLDTGDRAIGHVIAFRGSLNRVHCSPAGIFGPAMLANAAKVVLFHNHPSGRTEPSEPDVRMTRRLAQTGALLGIPVRDHLILGEPPRFGSLAALGHGFDYSDLAFAVDIDLERVWRRDGRREVKPKYRDPETGETWSGRGSVAGWLRRRIEAGARMEDFRVSDDRPAGCGVGRPDGWRSKP